MADDVYKSDYFMFLNVSKIMSSPLLNFTVIWIVCEFLNGGTFKIITMDSAPRR